MLDILGVNGFLLVECDSKGGKVVMSEESCRISLNDVFLSSTETNICYHVLNNELRYL